MFVVGLGVAARVSGLCYSSVASTVVQRVFGVASHAAAVVRCH